MFNKPIIIRCFFLFALITGPLIGTRAQEVFTIPASQVVIDGSEMNIQPGDSIFLEGGIRPELRFENLSGSEDQPVFIAIKDEKVIIETEAHTGILFLASTHVHLTGAIASEKYGIEVATSASMGISVTGFSSDVEIDHIAIHDVGFAGIMAKTDPSCSNPDLRDFVMRDLSFHDNHIYNTGGEGFYVGYSWYPTREVDCNGSTVTLYPHAIQGLRIYDNMIHDTGWDGLQVGSATANVRIYGNTIARYGLEGVEFQTGGVQISAGSTGDLYNNFIYNGVGGGVSFFGGGNNRLYNNVIMNTGGNAIYQNDRDARPATNWEIFNNTIINPGRAAIDLNATKTKGNLVANNLIVLENGFFSITGDDSSWKNEGNQLYGKIIEVGFEHPDTLNFRLTTASKALDAGYNIDYLVFDHDFNARPANGAYDVGAFEYDSEPYVPAPLAVDKNHHPSISVYPNPAGVGFVYFSITGERRPDSVKLIDATGKIVLTKNILFEDNGVYELEMGAGLESGLYFVLFYRANERVDVKRLILDR